MTPFPWKHAVDRRSQCFRRSGFTLVELLVVMAVITLLAGLTFPSLVRARAAAHGVRCISNLRQLGLAARLYWDDHDGRAFREGVSRSHGGQIYWFGWLQDGAEGTREFDPRMGKLWPYLQGRGVETCPSLTRSGPAFKSKARGGAFGYGYNLHLGPRDWNDAGHTPPAVVVDRLAEPARVAVFADCAQVNDFQEPATPAQPLLEEFYFFETRYRTVHFRHGGFATVVFVDGHVGLESPEPGSEDARLPGQRVGRLAPEIVLPR